MYNRQKRSKTTIRRSKNYLNRYEHASQTVPKMLANGFIEEEGDDDPNMQLESSEIAVTAAYDSNVDIIVCEESSSNVENYNIENLTREKETKNDDIPSVQVDNNNTYNKLRKWAVASNIPHSHLSGLLNILSNCDDSVKNMPKDPRTFLQTPRTVQITPMPPGSYVYLGLKAGLLKILKNIKCRGIIDIAINIDGLPLAKSSGSELYPIIGVAASKIFTIAIYHGNEKPYDFNEFIKDFVDEAADLSQNGLVINSNQAVSCRIKMILLDAVAKASVLCVKGHNGYSSCTKCTQRGVYQNKKMTFPSINFIKRTDESCIAESDPNYHYDRCKLLDIPNVGLVSSIPLDYMHLVCLGVVKQFLVKTWVHGKRPHKIHVNRVNSISNNLLNLKMYLPIEFARKPRTLKEGKRWKATEFRQFLLYTSPVVLKNILAIDKYYHFLTLTVAIRILLDNSLLNTYMDYAEELLKHFVDSTKTLYSPCFLTHNIHNLLHIVDDARRFGNIQNFSNFEFENYMQFYKKILRKKNDVLQQIVKRLQEIDSCNIVSKQKNIETGFKREHTGGPLIHGTTGPEYKLCVFEKFLLSVTKANCCCSLVDESIILVENFAFSTLFNKKVAIARKYSKSDFFQVPCKSSLVGIYFIKSPGALEMFSLEVIAKKLVRLPYRDGYVVMPLLHL